MIWALLACAGPPEHDLTWQEGWSMLAILNGRRILDARFSVGNTGLLRGQGQVQASVWSAEEDPLHFSATSAPEQVHLDPLREQVRLGDETLTRSSGRWSMRIADESFNAMLHLDPQTDLSPSEAWQTDRGQWRVAAESIGTITGWVAAGERGGPLEGRGVLLHWGGSGIPDPPRQAVYVLGRRLLLGVDDHGSGRLLFAELDGQPLPGSAAVQWGDPVRITLGSLTVTVRPRSPLGQSDPHEHLLRIERLLGGLILPLPQRQVQAGVAEVHSDALSFQAPALLLEEDEGLQ